MDAECNQLAMSRRAAVRLLVAGAGTVLLAACGPLTPAATPAATAVPAAAAKPGLATPAPASTPAAQPKPGGTLRIGNTLDLATIDGHYISPAVFDSIWMSYDRLTQYDAKLQPQPMLAESWEAGADKTSMKFNLRKGVQFHNGRELTSEDVKWNLLRVRDPKVGVAQLANQSKWFSDVQTPDKYTVILKSDSPRPALFDFLEYLNILDQGTMEGPDANTKVIGTGPFKFVERQQGDHVYFVRNPNYWQNGRPYVDEVQVRILGDQNAMVTQLEGNALDAIINPPIRDADRLRQDRNWQVIPNPQSGQFYLLVVNTTLPALSNKVVRQAISYAIDRGRFASTILHGLFEPRDLPWPPQSVAFDAAKAKAQAFDLNKAKALLDSAGVASLELDVVYTSANSELANLAQIIQADLAKVGVKLTIKPMEDAAWRDVNTKKTYNGLNLALGGLAGLEPITLPSTSAFWNPVNGISGFQSEPYSQILDSASSEPDATKRKAIYDQLNDLILNQSFAMTVSGTAPILAASTKVHDLHHSAHEGLIYTDAWIG